MFEIRTTYTIEETNRLHNGATKLNYYKSDADSTIGVLGTLTGMEGIVSRIRSISGNLYDEYVTYSQMAQAMDKINYYYSLNENRICDNAEQSTVYYSRRMVRNMNLTYAASYLDKDMRLE